MNRQLSQLAFCTLTFFTALAGSTPTSADHYRQINRMARRIDNTSALIVRESTYFVRSPHYNCLVNETHELRQLACHVRDIARVGCDLQHLQSDVIALGNAYSRLDAKLCLIEQVNPSCHNARRMRRLLDSVQKDISKMVASVTCLLNSRPQVLQPQVIQPVVPSQGYDYGPANPGYQYQTPGYGMNYGTGYGNGSGYGAGYGAGNGAGYGAGYGAGNGSGYGAGNGSGFGAGYGAGQGVIYGNSSSMGHPYAHGTLGRNQVRYPTTQGVQHQALQRSASLESQLRSMRSQPGATLNLGGGRLSISF